MYIPIRNLWAINHLKILKYRTTINLSKKYTHYILVYNVKMNVCPSVIYVLLNRSFDCDDIFRYKNRLRP